MFIYRYPNYPKGKFFWISTIKLQSTKIITLKYLEFQLFQEENKFKNKNYIKLFQFYNFCHCFWRICFKEKKYEIILVYATSPIFQAYIGVFLNF